MTSIYTPARSFFCEHVIWNPKNHAQAQQRLPKTIQGMHELEFLNKQALFHCDNALVSGGHADLNLNSDREYWVRNRDRSKTTIMGDSGGFQLAKGLWSADWLNMDKDAQEKRQSVFQWQQAFCDWGATLDMPYWVLGDEKASKGNNVHTTQDCLQVTLQNLDYYMQNSTGQTKWLNVLQGSTQAQAQDFYEKVRDYNRPTTKQDYARGWCMGGMQCIDPESTIKRLLKIREDGLLNTTERIHFLGTSKMFQVLLFDIISEVLNSLGYNIQITFDSSSPYLTAAKGSVITGVNLQGRWNLQMQPIPFTSQHVGSTQPAFNFIPGLDTKIMQRLTLGDIAYTQSKSSLDNMSYIFLQLHNLEKFFECINVSRQAYAQGQAPTNFGINQEVHALVKEIFTQDYTQALSTLEENKSVFQRLSRVQPTSTTQFKRLFDYA